MIGQQCLLHNKDRANRYSDNLRGLERERERFLPVRLLFEPFFWLSCQFFQQKPFLSCHDLSLSSVSGMVQLLEVWHQQLTSLLDPTTQLTVQIGAYL